MRYLFIIKLKKEYKMKNLLLCLTLALLFVGCTKENIATIEEAPSELKIAQDYLLKYQSVLLFANVELNHETRKVSGFVIDKKGDLFSFSDMSNPGIDPSTGFISDHLMRELLSLGKKETPANLSAIEVAANLKTAFKLSKKNSFVENDPAASSTHLLLNFSRNVTHQSPESCGPGQFDHGPSHHQNIISARGKFHFDNNFIAGPELSEWLTTLHGEVGGN